jgi:hypothetical protein
MAPLGFNNKSGASKRLVLGVGGLGGRDTLKVQIKGIGILV